MRKKSIGRLLEGVVMVKNKEVKEVVLDFSEIDRKAKEDEERDKAREEYSRRAREEGYVERKRKELEKREH